MKETETSLLAYVNAPASGEAPRGIVVDFMGLSNQWQYKPEDPPKGQVFSDAGLAYVIPYLDPWNWMNAGAVAMTDRIIDSVLRDYNLAPDTPVVSTGGSMGGLCALVWPRYSRHNIIAVAANCPVCDLPFHYTERPDLPRTLQAAFAAEPDFEAALRSRSPLHLAPTLPDVPYAIFHCTTDPLVAKSSHSDRFVEKMRSEGRTVEYVAVPDRWHCDLTPEARKRYEDFAISAFSAR